MANKYKVKKVYDMPAREVEVFWPESVVVGDELFTTSCDPDDVVLRMYQVTRVRKNGDIMGVPLNLNKE